MSIGLFAKLLHVFSAFWFMGGVIGRDVSFWRAARSESVHAIKDLLAMSEFFEVWGVIRGGLLVTVFGYLAAWRNGWQVFGFLQGASSNWLLVSLVLLTGGGLLIIPLRLIPRRRLREAAVEEALTVGTVTPELRAALDDKVVNWFRSAELGLLAVIIFLMVTKPF